MSYTPEKLLEIYREMRRMIGIAAQLKDQRPPLGLCTLFGKIVPKQAWINDDQLAQLHLKDLILHKPHTTYSPSYWFKPHDYQRQMDVLDAVIKQMEIRTLHHTPIYDLPHQVKTLREKCDLNQHQLAHIVGITRSRLESIEQGTTYPTIDVVMKMAARFNVTLDQLVKGENP
jgi:DNA-binding XRE family transcriptional regulator